MVVFWYNYSINEGDNMKKLSVLFVLLCLPTFAFGDVCSLSFRGGYKTEKKVVTAVWWGDGMVSLEDASGSAVQVNGDFGYDYKDVSLDKLESVNGKHISVPNFLYGSFVVFNCDKWQNGEYFAYSCGSGFQGVNKVGTYLNVIDMYEECIKKAQTSDKNGGVAAATTKSGSVMKNDPNAIGILDCVIGKAAGWEEENYDCSAKHESWSHNYHSTKAICKKFVADAYYKKYKDNTGMTGRDWPDYVGKLPELIDGKYMLRCVATECEDGYELARDKNGNSQGWCRKKSADKNEKADTGEKSGSGQGDTAESNNGESKSGDDNNVTEGESAKETTQGKIEKSDDVFAKIDLDLIKYFSKSSVWKKDDGSFNTARLASDSIAGVVLGTTGGIITSNVIKKNQIKKGFEDLKCTIGGQSVAAYGDEFSVGVK